MAWVVDKGLDRLLAQINAAAPNRSKASDGSIGDQSHAAGYSEHNPEASAGNDPRNQVDARDYTHDPGRGADMGKISEALRQSKDRRILYVIFNRRIFSGAAGPQPWVWRSYSGDNPHDHHMHVSVNDTHNDETQDWQIGGGGVLMALSDAQQKEMFDKVNATAVAVAEHAKLFGWVIGRGVPVDDGTSDGMEAWTWWGGRVTTRLKAILARLESQQTPAPVELDYDKLAAALLREMAAPR